MEMQWCWGLKKHVPYLDEDEWRELWSICGTDFPLKHKAALLAKYEQMTGYKEDQFNALFGRRLSRLGPPCPRCGKVLRTPVAYKCFECGLQVHEPGWSFLFKLKEAPGFAINGRGTVLIVDSDQLKDRLAAGDEVVIRDGSRTVAQATVLGIEAFHGPPSPSPMLGVLVSSLVAVENLHPGQEVWLAAKRDPAP